MEIDHNDEDNEGVTQINSAGPQMMGNIQNGSITQFDILCTHDTMIHFLVIR